MSLSIWTHFSQIKNFSSIEFTQGRSWWIWNISETGKGNIFWPGMTRQIKEKVRNCETCARFASSQPKPPMLIDPIAQYLFQNVFIDVFHNGCVIILSWISWRMRRVQLLSMRQWNGMAFLRKFIRIMVHILWAMNWKRVRKGYQHPRQTISK